MEAWLKPMLCKDEQPRVSTLGSGWLCERKFDGWRAVVHHDEHGRVHLYGGRNGSDYSGQLPAIEAELKHLIPPDTAIDGELISEMNGWGGVQHVMRSGAAPTDGHGDLKLIVFDLTRLCTRDIRGVELLQRRGALEDENVFPFDQCDHVELAGRLPSTVQSHQAIVKAGGEGTVWKRIDSPYLSGRRSPHWLKWKHETSDEAEVVGFKPGEGEFAGMVGAIEFRLLVNGVTSRCSGMNLTERSDMTMNPQNWLGEIIEVKHNGLLASGAPRHPQYLRKRSDRSVAPNRSTAPTRATVSNAAARARSRTPRAGWMRNHGAMSPMKLQDVLRDYERGSGPAVDRVLENGGDVDANYRKAMEAARKKGLR